MCLPTYQAIRHMYADSDGDGAMTSLADALRTGDDLLHVLVYLNGLGCPVTTLPELLAAVRGLEDEGEEELAAFECQEGVAVSAASDGRWLLFTP